MVIIPFDASLVDKIARRIRPMKKVNLILLSVLLLATGFILVACGSESDLLMGEYKIEDVVYVGEISSATKDALIEAKAKVKVIIKNDSLEIIYPENAEQWTDIKVVKDELSDEFISSKYAEENTQLISFFNKYSERYRYSLFDNTGEQINYYLFLMDNQLFISQFARSDSIIFSIDKLAFSEQFSSLSNENVTDFLSQLDRYLTLDQAVSKYPAILDYFPFDQASEDIDLSSKTYIDGSEVSAYDLLSQLNARRNSNPAK